MLKKILQVVIVAIVGLTMLAGPAFAQPPSRHFGGPAPTYRHFPAPPQVRHAPSFRLIIRPPVRYLTRPHVYCNFNACAHTYRSFRASDCTYQPYNGPRQFCPL